MTSVCIFDHYLCHLYRERKMTRDILSFSAGRKLQKRRWEEPLLAAYNLIWSFASKQIRVLIKGFFSSYLRLAEEEQNRGKNSANYHTPHWKGRLEIQLDTKRLMVVSRLESNIIKLDQRSGYAFRGNYWTTKTEHFPNTVTRNV